MISVLSYAESPIEIYDGWNQELKDYTAKICESYDVDYSLVLAVIYNESRFQSGKTHLNSNGTTDYGLMQVNEVNFDYLHKTIGINSMSDLLDDKTGIKCGVELLAYHKDFTENDSSALLRYQIGAGKYKKYQQSGRTTNDVHSRVLEIKDEYSEYLESQKQQTDSGIYLEQNRILKILNRWAEMLT